MEIKVEIQTPRVPNFVQVLLAGEQVKRSMSVKHLSEEQIREIGARWTDAMILRAKELRENAGGEK